MYESGERNMSVRDACAYEPGSHRNRYTEYKTNWDLQDAHLPDKLPGTTGHNKAIRNVRENRCLGAGSIAAPGARFDLRVICCACQKNRHPVMLSVSPSYIEQ